jgi:hypothetical protein
MNTLSKKFCAMIISASLLIASFSAALAEEQTVHERMMHHRAVESLVWAMPLLNFKASRDGHAAIGAGKNVVGYYSVIQDWRFQLATPNNTTPYVNFYWDLRDGPIVVEIPPSGEGVAIFGTLMDAWQRALEDVGAMGKDRGFGAKYVIVPPGYSGPLLAGGITLHQKTLNGFAVLRPIIPSGSKENVAKAVAFAQKIKVYPLAQANNPPKTKYVDLHGPVLEGMSTFDQHIYAELNEIIQEEVIDKERDMAMMGMLAQIGIQKGKAFKPSSEMKEVYAKAAPDALQYMIEQYHKVLVPEIWEGKKWTYLVPEGSVETAMTYEFDNRYDYHARGVLYYAVVTSVKNYGVGASANYYADLALDKNGKWLDGSKLYKMNVPANVPAKNFWSVTAYDLETASYIRDTSKSSIDSNQSSLKKNSDGSYDVYFGPKAPKGKEGNWVPTKKGQRFFMLFRFYGATEAIYDGSYELNDIELMD